MEKKQQGGAQSEDSVYSNMLKSIKPHGLEDSSNPLKISLKVETCGNYQEEGIIGDKLTHLAFKNPNSFMIVTSTKGIKLIENSTEIYSAELSGAPQCSVLDTIYIKHLDCYLLRFYLRIYRKDIDDNPPYLYMGLRCSGRFRGAFRYSPLNRRLIQKGGPLSIVNLEKKRIELQIKHKDFTLIMDYKVFGKDENKIILLNHYGTIFVLTISYSLKKVCSIHSIKCEFGEEFEGQGLRLALDDSYEYILMEIESFR